uniref:transmembrane anterior posterior transformation protein 1 homolog n=2 Tax=Myxine glutinosa TaxID=7769 RepID=UPI00358E8B1B
MAAEHRDLPHGDEVTQLQDLKEKGREDEHKWTGSLGDRKPPPETLGQRDAGPREGFTLRRFLAKELKRGYLLERQESSFTARRQRVYTFLRVPRELERLMVFGTCLCLDSFLFVFTFLPLRVVAASLHLLLRPFHGLRSGRLLQPAQTCDMLKAAVIILCFIAMRWVDYSMIYHLIRGQSVIKLYIIYNMLEVADRLFSSFGQDVLDAMYWTATEPKRKKREHLSLLAHFCMAVLYVFFHAILVLFQATTLNVAFNSHNKSLLTVMLSNNFVELKGSVFKRCEKKNLFQLSNSDIRERFHNVILLLIVCLRNMEQFSWNPDHLWVLVPDLLLVLGAEVLVDVVKHAFITKFNDITAEVYVEYRASLAYELVCSKQHHAYTDHTDAVSRRMGFIPLSLAVVLSRVVSSCIRIDEPVAIITAIIFYLGLFASKILTSIMLLGKSWQYVCEAHMDEFGTFNNGDKAEASSTPTSDDPPGEAKDRPSHPSESAGHTSEKGGSGTWDPTPSTVGPSLLAVDRFTICGGHIN